MQEGYGGFILWCGMVWFWGFGHLVFVFVFICFIIYGWKSNV